MLYGSPYGRYGEAAFGGSTSPKDGGSAVSGSSDDMIALRHLREQVAVIVPDVRLLVGPRSCTCTSPFTSRQSCHVSSPYFKQLILGLWFGFCFTFHELLGLQLHVQLVCQLGLQLRVPLQLRRLLRWSSIGAREGFCLLCLLSLEPWINKNFFKGQGQQVVWRVARAVSYTHLTLPTNREV